MSARLRREMGFGLTLLASALLSVVLYFVGAWRNHSWDFYYLLWNLFLAWIPLVLALIIVRYLRNHRWSSWRGIGLTFFWLFFLPNSFYMVTDYIHLQETGRVDVLFDALMFTSFITNGLAVGFVSLYLLHKQLRKRLPTVNALVTVELVLFLCSFAIYLGRDLRWNSWDLITNPAGVLFDVTQRVLHPMTYPQMFVTTLTFFALLSSLYAIIWQAARSRPRL